MRTCKNILRPQHCPQCFSLPRPTQIHIESANCNQLPAQTNDGHGSYQALLSSPHDMHCTASLSAQSKSLTPWIQVLQSSFGSRSLALISVSCFSTFTNGTDTNKSSSRILLKIRPSVKVWILKLKGVWFVSNVFWLCLVYWQLQWVGDGIVKHGFVSSRIGNSLTFRVGA